MASDLGPTCPDDRRSAIAFAVSSSGGAFLSLNMSNGDVLLRQRELGTVSWFALSQVAVAPVL